MGTLIVGYEGSEGSGAALGAALDLAGELGDEVVIVFGYDPGNIGAPEEAAAHRAAVRELGEKVTNEAVEKADGSGVTTTVELIAERPVEALLSAAEKHDARAIVVGSYRESPIKGAILGSTPHKLLHWAEHPVLVVPVADSE